MIIAPLVFVALQPVVAAANSVESNLTVIACPIGNPDPVKEIEVAEPATTPVLGEIATEAIVVVMLAVAVL